MISQSRIPKVVYVAVLIPRGTDGKYRVVLAQENDGKKWILTAFDNSKTKKEKLSSVNTPGTPIDNSGSRAVAADDASLSKGKDTNNISNDQENLGKTSSPEEIAQEEAKVDINPTEGQKEAGNYQKGHINVDGYDITIENPKGSVRSGVDSKGNRWETTMHNTYGYIRGTEGVDGDHIDVFLSDNPASGSVFVVDQVNPESGAFDEHKVMYGFASEEEARKAYLSNYSEGWQGLGAITEVSREEFAKWIKSSHRKTRPFAEYKSVKKALNSQNSLNRKEIVSESEGNSVPLPQRTRKSYTDGKGNYHRGLEEELADIEAAISGGGEAAEGAASQSSATSEGTRGDVDSLRRQAALIRAEIARRDQLKQEFRKKYNISEKGELSMQVQRY